MAKILLIPAHQDNSQLPKSVFTANERIGFPNGVYRLGSFVENNGHKVDVYDLNLKGNSKEKLLEKIKNEKYDIVGSSTSHMTLHNDLDISHIIKNTFPNITFLFGGQEATLAPDLMAKYGRADFLVSGEGEIPLLNIAKKHDYFKKEGLNRLNREISDILGVSTVHDGKVIRANKNKCLDEENFIKTVMGIDYNKIDFESYWAQSGMQNISAYTANYCPAGCNFCSSSTFLKSATDNPVRLTSISAEDLFNLYSKISNREGVKEFYLTDDNALVGYEQREALRKTVQDLESRLRSNDLSNEERNKIIGLVRGKEERIYKNMITRMEDFCDMTIKNIPPEKRIPLIIQSRLDYIPPELLRKLKSAGVRLIGYGLENFSFTAHKLLNKNININLGKKLIQDTLDAGINPYLNLIHLPPLSSTDDAFYNITQALKFSSKGCNIGIYPQIIPFAGTFFDKTEPFLKDSKKINLAIGNTGLNLVMPWAVRLYSEEASFYLTLTDKNYFNMLVKNQNLNEDYKLELEYLRDSMDFYLGMNEKQIFSLDKKERNNLMLDKLESLSVEDKFNYELEELREQADKKALENYNNLNDAIIKRNAKPISTPDISMIYMTSFLQVSGKVDSMYPKFGDKIYNQFINLKLRKY